MLQGKLPVLRVVQSSGVLEGATTVVKIKSNASITAGETIICN
jgi:hypothetical protein